MLACKEDDTRTLKVRVRSGTTALRRKLLIRRGTRGKLVMATMWPHQWVVNRYNDKTTPGHRMEQTTPLKIVLWISLTITL